MVVAVSATLVALCVAQGSGMLPAMDNLLRRALAFAPPTEVDMHLHGVVERSLAPHGPVGVLRRVRDRLHTR